jgi:hypothetical protein
LPAGLTRRFSPEALLRFGLVPIAVGICYLLGWHWLRHLTLEWNLGLDALAGIHLQRLSSETVLWRSEIYRYEIACTMADVWCGALPLIWSLRKSIGANIAYALLFGIVIIGFNVFRLTVSDVLFAIGIPWDLAHNVISGVSYFLIWMWIWRTRNWALHRGTALQ